MPDTRKRKRNAIYYTKSKSSQRKRTRLRTTQKRSGGGFKPVGKPGMDLVDFQQRERERQILIDELAYDFTFLQFEIIKKKRVPPFTIDQIRARIIAWFNNNGQIRLRFHDIVEYMADEFIKQNAKYDLRMAYDKR